MPETNQDKITFDGLQQFLRSIGFDHSVKVNESLAFQHHDSGTILALSIPKDGRTVRAADLLSIVMRLEGEGLVDDTVLEQFKSGRLPMASQEQLP